MDRKFLSLDTADDLSILNGHAFEEYLTQLFSDLGYAVKKTPGSGDYGADLILETAESRIVVQAKQYKSDVGFDAVKEIHFAKTFYEADEAWVVCTKEFTRQAVEAASTTNVRLVNGAELGMFIGMAHRGELLSEAPLSVSPYDPESFEGPEGNIVAGIAFEELWRKPTFKASDVAATLQVSVAKACAVCRAMDWDQVPTTEKVWVYGAEWLENDRSDHFVALGEEFQKMWDKSVFKAKDIADTLHISVSRACAVCRAMGWSEALQPRR